MREFHLIDSTGVRESIRWPIDDVAGSASNYGIVNIHGHSWSDNKSGLGRRIGALLNLEPPNIRHHGLGGSQLLSMLGGTAGTSVRTAGWSTVQTRIRPTHQPRTALSPYVPYMATGGAHVVILTTVNDVDIWGNPAANGGQLLEAYKGAWRSNLARFRAGAIFGPIDVVAVVAKPGAPGAWVNEASPYTSGGRVWSCSTVNSALNLAVPADYQGGFVNVRIVGEHGPGCATFTISGAGITPQTGSTHNYMPVAGSALGGYLSLGIINKRIPLANTGAVQTLTLTNTSGGRLAFSCFEIEDPNPPPVVALLSPRVVGWTPGGTGPGAGSPAGREPGDTWTTAYDAATTAVFAEFGGPVGLVDVSDVLDGVLFPERWANAIHPNEYGMEFIADRLVSKLNSLSVVATARAMEHA